MAEPPHDRICTLSGILPTTGTVSLSAVQTDDAGEGVLGITISVEGDQNVLKELEFTFHDAEGVLVPVEPRIPLREAWIFGTQEGVATLRNTIAALAGDADVVAESLPPMSPLSLESIELIPPLEAIGVASQDRRVVFFLVDDQDLTEIRFITNDLIIDPTEYARSSAALVRRFLPGVDAASREVALPGGSLLGTCKVNCGGPVDCECTGTPCFCTVQPVECRCGDPVTEICSCTSGGGCICQAAE